MPGTPATPVSTTSLLFPPFQSACKLSTHPPLPLCSLMQFQSTLARRNSFDASAITPSRFASATGFEDESSGGEDDLEVERSLIEENEESFEEEDVEEEEEEPVVQQPSTPKVSSSFLSFRPNSTSSRLTDSFAISSLIRSLPSSLFPSLLEPTTLLKPSLSRARTERTSLEPWALPFEWLPLRCIDPESALECPSGCRRFRSSRMRRRRKSKRRR